MCITPIVLQHVVYQLLHVLVKYCVSAMYSLCHVVVVIYCVTAISYLIYVSATVV